MMNYALNLSPLYLSVSGNRKALSLNMAHDILYGETNVCLWIRMKQLLGSVEILVLSNITVIFSFLYFFG